MPVGNKKSILITGGDGYIATALNNALKSVYNTTAITRRDFDLTDSSKVNDFFKDKHFDVVLHTASCGGSRLKTDNKNTLQTNVCMFQNILTNKKYYGRLINFGSGAEKYALHTEYGQSKKIIAENIKKEKNHYNICIYAVFDENELNTRFIKANILRYKEQQPITIHQDKFMDFFYMKDLIKLVEWYIKESTPPKLIDCTYCKNYKLTNIADLINLLTRNKVQINILKKELDNPYTGNYTDIGLKYVGLEQGIKEVYTLL